MCLAVDYLAPRGFAVGATKAAYSTLDVGERACAFTVCTNCGGKLVPNFSVSKRSYPELSLRGSFHLPLHLLLSVLLWFLQVLLLGIVCFGDESYLSIENFGVYILLGFSMLNFVSNNSAG